MRILIVGAGIAGTTLAALLKQRGVEPVVIEKAQAWGRVGYVLGLWPLGSRVLHGLGLYDAFLDRSVPFRHYDVLDGQGKVVGSYELPQSFNDRYGDTVCLQRWELLELMRQALGDLPIRMGTTLQSLAQTDGRVQVTFDDGSTDEFDLVVGCDGIRSETRRLVFGDVPLHYTGQTGWAWWIEPKFQAPERIAEYWARGLFFGLYPAKGALCVFAGASARANAPDPVDRRIDRLRSTFGRLGGTAQQVLDELPPPDQIFHDDFNDLKMDTWHQGRVLLIGDASAAFLPSAGVGASAAMESAAVLADELSRADARRLDLAIKLFEARRMRRVHKMQDDSRLLWRLAFTENAVLTGARNLLLGHVSSEQFLRNFEGLLEQPI